jgi:hypothetical protein
MCRKCRKPDTQASNSRSNAEYLTWAQSSFLEKNPRGRHGAAGWGRCWRAAPIWSAVASTCKATSAPWVGWMSRTQPARAAFAAENAACISAVHGMAAAGLGPPFNWSVSGFRMRAAAGINRR